MGNGPGGELPKWKVVLVGNHYSRKSSLWRIVQVKVNWWDILSSGELSLLGSCPYWGDVLIVFG